MMKRKYIFYSIVFLVLCLSFSACLNQGGILLRKVDQNYIIYTHQNAICSYSQLTRSIEQKKNLQDFCKDFGLEYYKEINKQYYTVITTTRGRFLVWFDGEEKIGSMQKILFSSKKCRPSFDCIVPGTELSEVRRIDPDGQYDFLYSSWSGIPQSSYHFFKSGECFYILYNNNAVEKIVSFMI